MNKLILLLVLIVGLSSCSKEDDAKKPSIMAQLAAKARGYDLNAEGEAIVADMEDAEFSLSLHHTANYGEKLDVKLNGSLPGSSGITINGASYSPINGGDFYRAYDDSTAQMEQYFGTTVSMVAAPGVSCSFGVPEPILGSKLSNGQGIYIDGNGVNEITWEPAQVNPTGQIAIKYLLFVSDSPGEIHSEGVVVTEDDGSFNISSLLDQGAESILFILSRGNGRNVETPDAKTFFNVRSDDHHYYVVEWN